MIVRHYKIPITYPITFYQIKIEEEFNSSYLVDQIEKNINQELSFQTNVKGSMTDWRFFLRDKYFTNLLKTFLEKNKIEFNQPLALEDAWGIKIEPEQKTIIHNHLECLAAGILYLNDCDNKIVFPQINTEINIEKNTLLIFSGILDHFTTPVSGKNTKYAIAFNLKEAKPWSKYE